MFVGVGNTAVDLPLPTLDGLLSPVQVSNAVVRIMNVPTRDGPFRKLLGSMIDLDKRYPLWFPYV